jgi:cytochrome P450
LAAEFVGPIVRHPPGPRGWPYFGCLGGLLRNPMDFWNGIANRYGGIARVPLMRGRTVYLIADPTMLYELLVTKRSKYRKNTRYRAAVEVFGEGLLLREGEPWKRQRLLTQPAFKADYVGAQVPWMAKHTAAFLDGWRRRAERGETFDVEKDFLDLSQLLAGYYLMGPAFETIAERFCKAALAIKDHWPRPPRNVLRVLFRRGDGWSPELAAAARDIDACLYEYLAAERKRGFADGAVVKMIAEGSREQGDEFDDRSLRDQILTLFFAGHETTATTLTWLHYLLSRHPKVRARMQGEISRVLGSGEPTLESLDALTYTDQVINETLRLYSPIHSISRVALEDDTIGGYSIPAGAMIYVSLYATHRLPQVWPKPDEFDPERFAPGADSARPRFAFIPFAAGHRNCIGASAAAVETKLAAALLAQRYVLDLAPGQRVVGAAGTTMHPRYGMKMRISPAEPPRQSA